MQFQKRVIGCFKALATGDAVGKQTEMLSRADVLRWYPEGVAGFHGRPGEVIPRYAGKRYQWRCHHHGQQYVGAARKLIRRQSRHESV